MLVGNACRLNVCRNLYENHYNRIGHGLSGRTVRCIIAKQITDSPLSVSVS